MAALPTGTVTFLFTDVEGSTRLLQQLGDRYAEVIATHHRLLRAAIQDGHGHEMDTQGDALFVAFPRARDALQAAVAAQRALHAHPWPDGIIVRVRMGLHTGEPLSGETGYVGMDVHRAARVAAAGHGGQILLSDVTHGLVVKDLPEGVGLRDLGEHRLKDLAHPYRLFQIVAADLPADFPPIRSLDILPNNLPRQLTSFIGRDKEMAEVKRHLSTAYLVTLTGSGGAGKTRLALQVAADVVEGYPDGVWLAAFAPIADPALVPKTVASALCVPEQPGREMTDTLVDALRPKALLLVLDNCEHLLAACADLAAVLLRACPQVRILATSREALGIPGETLWRVPSLSLPDVRRLPPSEGLVLYEAVRLFVDRAIATTPGFTIATRLDDRFRLLIGGSRIVLPRHQTLRGAIDWSYELLSEKERVVLRRLSVFAGGWTLEAAEAICSGDGLEASGVLDVLAALVDKSLVLAETHDEAARYRLLETVREYGQEKLQESGENRQTRSRHRDFFLVLAESAEPHARTESVVWLTRLEGEHDNLRAALAWSLLERDEEASLRLVGALAWFWSRRCHYGEGQQWLKEVLERSTRAATVYLARALLGSAFLTWSLGDYKHAAEPAEEALALYRQLGYEGDMACSAYVTGIVNMARGHYKRAAALLEESLARFRTLDDKWGIASSLRHGGQNAARRGDYGRAEILLEESIALYREMGNDLGAAWALRHLGMSAVNQGDHRRARELLTQSLVLFQEMDDKDGIAYTLTGLGSVARHEAANDQAVGFYGEALTMSRAIRSQWVTVECLFGLAAVSGSQGVPGRAARLFSAAEALREAIDYLLPARERAEFEQARAASRAALGEHVFTSVWTDGRAMTLEQAIEYALNRETRPEEAHGSSSNVAPK